MLPLSILDAPAFTNFITSLDSKYTLPSRKNMSTTLLTKKAEEIKTKMTDILQEAECVSLTLDFWSNRQMRGFLGITCHVVKDWTLLSLMIECQRFRGHHTAENIWHYYSEAIASHGISEKIVTTVTDNASNVVKAFKFPGFSKGNDDQPESELGSEDEDSVDDVEPVDIEEAGLEFLPEHDTCFAHTLQLVVKDGFKEAESLNKVLVKAGKIVTCSKIYKRQ